MFTLEGGTKGGRFSQCWMLKSGSLFLQTWCWSPGALCSAPLVKFIHVRKGEALALHSSAMSEEEQKSTSPWGNVPGSGLGWDHRLLEPAGGFCEVRVSLLD